MRSVYVGMLIMFMSLACAGENTYTNNAELDGVHLAMRNTEATKAELQRLLQAGSSTAKYDFVSGYDFSSARLQDLPWSLRWLGAGEFSEGEYCECVATNHNDWCFLDYDYQGEFPPVKRAYSDIDEQTCRLTEGAFYGELYVTNGVLTARKVDGPYARGIKLTVLGFRNVNEDDYMDVICRFYNDTGGTASSLHAVVLTRQSTNGMFRVILS